MRIRWIIGLTAALLVLAGSSNAAASADLTLGGTNSTVAAYSDGVVYAISVTNLGPNMATGVVVSNQIPANFQFDSATGGATPTNGVLLVNLGVLAAGSVTNITIHMTPTNYVVGFYTNVFYVSANEIDPVPANNSVALVTHLVLPATQFTTSVAEYDSNHITTVSQQVTNYSTELIAKLPNGTVVYDQTFTAAFSDPTVQSAITTAAGDLSGAGAPSYTGPVQTGFSQTTNNSSVAGPISTNINLITGTKQWVGPVTFRVGNYGIVTGYTFDPVVTNYPIATGGNPQSLTLPPGDTDFDTMILSLFDFFLTTTNTATYTNASVYTMTGVQAIPGTPLTISGSNLGGAVIVFSGLAFGIGPIEETDPGSSGFTTITAVPGDLVVLNNPAGGNNPTNWAAVVRYFNPADPAGSNNLAATESQTFFATNFGGGGFAGFQLFPNTYFTPPTAVSTTNGVTSVVSTVEMFGPSGDAILAGQSAIFILTAYSPFTDLSLSASAAPQPATVGSNLVYTLTVSNALPTFAPQTVTATGVVVSNRIPANCTFVSATGGATPTNGVLLVNLGSLAEGTNTSVQIVVKPTTAGQLTNNFEVFANEVDPNVTNNSVTMVSTVTNAPVVLAPAVPGTPIAWTNPGGALLVTETFASGGNPVPIQTGIGNNLASTGQAGDLILLFTTNGVTAPTNWAAVVRFFNPADPTGGNGLAATYSQAFFATNFGGSGFNGYELFPVVSYIPEGLVTTYSNGLTVFITTYTQFGPVGGILAGQEDIAAVSVSTLTSVVNISSPTNGQVVSNAALTVTGTATNLVNSAVTNVFVQLKGGTWTNATTLNGWTNWSANVTLTPGSNTVSAYAVDGYGSFSPTNSVTFDYATGASPQADLSLSASAATNVIWITNNLTYSIVVSNAGPATATGVVISNQIPLGFDFISATGGAMPTNGTLLVNLGSLAAGATNSAQIVLHPNSSFTELYFRNGLAFAAITNVFQVFAAQADPVPTNNSATVVIGVNWTTVTYTTSTLAFETSLMANVSQQATNYSTELVAVMPNGTVVYSNAFAVPFSPGALQAAITTAATDLTNAGASAYIGPTQTSAALTPQGSSSITVTNAIGTNLSTAVNIYIGPQSIMVGTNQSQTFVIPAGWTDIDTLTTSDVTNLLTTTITSNYLASSVYVMTGLVAQADLILSASGSPNPVGPGSNLVYSITVSNAGPSAASGVVVSNFLAPLGLTFVSASDGSTLTNGVLLVNLGSLAVGATNSLQIVEVPNLESGDKTFTNLFQVFADQTDPDITNNSANVVSSVSGTNTVTATSSTRTIETNFMSSVNQQVTNYSTKLIAVMPGGAIVYSNAFAVPFSPGALQAAITSAATDLTNAGASSYTGPTETSFSQILAGNSLVTVTNPIGTNVSVVTAVYVGPQTIFVGTNQTTPFAIVAGGIDVDTLTTFEVTNLLTTTITSNYLASSVYVMTGIVAQADLSITVSGLPNPVNVSSNLAYFVTVSNAGPSIATGVVVSNQLPQFPHGLTFVSASDGSTATNGVWLDNLGSLAVGATNSLRIVERPSDLEFPGATYTNLFRVYADETDPGLTNNSATVINTYAGTNTVTSTASTRSIETNLVSNVSQQVTNYSTELIAMMPNGTVVYSNAFTIPFSPGALQAAITTAATHLTNAGASSYTGPTQTSFSQILAGNSSVTVTNPIGTNILVVTSEYVGPQTIFVGTNQTTPFTIVAGGIDFDTLTTFDITNLVVTTTTNSYLASSVYVMTGVVAEASADLILSVSAAPEVHVNSNLVYSITVSNAGPATATGVTVSNGIPFGVNFISATGGATPTNGILLVNLGALAAGATNLIQIVEQPTIQSTALTNHTSGGGGGYEGWFTNVFQTFANQTDPVPANNSAAVVTGVTNTDTFFTTSTRTFETNLAASVNQQVTNYSTELIARMPDGTVVYSNTFAIPFSMGALQAAITTAATDLTNAGATSYTGPTQTSFLQSLLGSSSVTATNPIGTNVIVTVNTYIGPTNIFVGDNQTNPFSVPPGGIDIDTLIIYDVTNLVTTTITSNYVVSAVYAMTGIVAQAQADLSLTVSAAPNPITLSNYASGFLTYTVTVSNAGPATATDIVVSNQLFLTNNFGAGSPFSFVSSSSGDTLTNNGVLMMHLGSLFPGAVMNAQFVAYLTVSGKFGITPYYTNDFAVYADQTDPDPSNNFYSLTLAASGADGLIYTASSLSLETNLQTTVGLSATNYSTQLIAVMPGGTVVYSQTFSNTFSDPAVQAAIATAAGDLTNAGASAHTGPAQTSHLESLLGSSSVTVTNPIGTNLIVTVTTKAVVISTQTDSQPANNRVTNITTAVSVAATNLSVTALSGITLNLQAGLFEQRVRVSNGGPGTPSWVRVLVSGLASNARLWNASGSTNGTPFCKAIRRWVSAPTWIWC